MSAFTWHEHFVQTLRESLNYFPCHSDNDIWLRKATKPDGVAYYEMIFVYTGDILVVSHKPKESLTMLDHHYLLKPDSIGIPHTYLGSQVGTFNIQNDPSQWCWYLGSEKYVKAATHNIKQWAKKRGEILKTKAAGILPSRY